MSGPTARPTRAGQRVLVTRARCQAASLLGQLEERGARPVLCPTIEMVAPEDPGPLDRALARLSTYDWVLVTSANTVGFLRARMDALGLGPEEFRALRVAAIGPATARALRESGIPVDLVPPSYVAESVFAALGAENVRGRRFLLPRAAEAREVLPRAIRAEGGAIDVVTAYVTRIPPAAAACLRAAIDAGPLDAALFTSSSTVRNFVTLAGGEAEARRLLAGAAVVCIGPVVEASARECGLRVDAVADPYSVEGLLGALDRLLAARG